MSIGGFAKVKAATHKLTGEKVTCIEVYNSNNIQCVYCRLPLRLWIKFN